MTRHTFRTDLGPGVQDTYADRMREVAAREGCRNLLRAQLRAGQHMLLLPLAQALGATIGMHPVEVRAATSASTTTNEGTAR